MKVAKKGNKGSITVKEKKLFFKVELEYEESGEISAGPFVFEQDGNLEDRSRDWEENKEKYQEYANKIMTQHYQFYQNITDKEYVTRGSILTCSCGTEPITIQLPEDHGIKNVHLKPLLTCKDCEAGTHIGSFGTCNCNPESYEGLTMYGKYTPHPSELSGAQQEDGRGKYKCFPILSHEWITKNQDFMVYVENVEEEGFYAALEKDAYLICLYGGVITIEEVPDVSQDEPSKESTTSEEPYSDFYDHFDYDWMKEGLQSSPYVTPQFLQKVDEISQMLEINPDDLMAVMAFESWLDPTTKREGGAVGLTQFTQISIDQINIDNKTNYTKTDILNMNAIEQLDLVYLLLKPHTGKMDNLKDVYMGVIAPARIGKDETAIMYSRENSNEAYENNKGLDKDDKGYITIGDAVNAVLKRRKNYE